MPLAVQLLRAETGTFEWLVKSVAQQVIYDISHHSPGKQCHSSQLSVLSLILCVCTAVCFPLSS